MLWTVSQRPQEPGLCSHNGNGTRHTVPAVLARVAALCGLTSMMLCAVAAGTAAAQGTASSPTGRNPRLFWTPQRQWVWNKLVADNGLLWRNFNSRAVEYPARYGNYGDYPTMAYQMTGKISYAQTAWKILQQWIPTKTLPDPSANGIRQYFTTFVWEYDWLYPALTATQRKQFYTWLNWQADEALGNATDFACGAILSQNDRTMGEYFGLAFMDLATGPDNPRAGTFLNSTFANGWGGPTTPVGGLNATGANMNSMRNAISYYAQLGQGGVWMQSWMYNLNTLPMILMGVEGVKTAAGKDYFPELTALYPQFAATQLYELTPTVTDSYQWGDVQQNRDLWMCWRQTADGMLEGLTSANPAGAYLNQLTSEFAVSPDDWSAGQWPYPVFFLFYNPYATKTNWRTAALPASVYASGQGLLYYHDGWGATNSLFGAHATSDTWCDHETNFTGDFQLYRHGEWGITHTLGYALSANPGGAPPTNTMLFDGLPVFEEARGPVAQETSDGNYAYLKGTTGGQYEEPPFWIPPPTFVHEWTRSIVYLPSQDKHSDTVVVFDRTCVDDPTKLPGGISRFLNAAGPMVQKAPALKQWTIHCPVKPLVSANAITWKTAGGQNVQVSTILPAAQTRLVNNEVIMGYQGYLCPDEEFWDVQISPSKVNLWDTFLNVVQVYDTGAQLNNTLVNSTAGEAQGTLISRENQNDVLALFNAEQGPAVPVTPLAGADLQYNPNLLGILKKQAVLQSGYTVNWTSRAAAANVLLFDLSPSHAWTVSVDRGASASLNVSANGVGKLTVNGVGAHQIVLQ